jgi:hypothetical protein
MTPAEVALLMRTLLTLLIALRQTAAGTYVHEAIEERIRELREHLAEGGKE